MMRWWRSSNLTLVARVAVAALIVAATPAIAGIFARVETPDDAIRMWRIDSGHGGIFVGEIIERDVHRVELPDMGEVEVTSLRVRVTDKVTPRTSDPEVIRVVYLGGAEYRTSAQPSDRETQVGVTVALLLTANPFPKETGEKSLWLSGLDAIYPVKVNASGDRVVLGKWGGMAVKQNTRLVEFLDSHREALGRVVAAKNARGGK